MRKLEVIVLNKEDSIVAEQAGADRLELVSEMAVGGLSPDIDVVRAVVESVSIPVNVMVRFKSTDFVYDEADMKLLIEYIETIKDLGINGIVFGSLDNQGNVNREQLQLIIDHCQGLEITYHRAIDQSQSQYLSNVEIIDGHVTNVLTSGGIETSITENIDLLASISDKRLNVLVGGGIKADNYQLLFNRLKLVDFHIGSLAYNNGDFSAGINSEMVKAVNSQLNK